MTELKELVEWYKSQCDGEWEHMHGIKIDTLDNPGWTLEIAVCGDLNRHVFSPIHESESDSAWLNCEKINGVFLGSCDPTQLPRLISIFTEWVKTCPRKAPCVPQFDNRG